MSGITPPPKKKKMCSHGDLIKENPAESKHFICLFVYFLGGGVSFGHGVLDQGLDSGLSLILLYHEDGPVGSFCIPIEP